MEKYIKQDYFLQIQLLMSIVFLQSMELTILQHISEDIKTKEEPRLHISSFWNQTYMLKAKYNKMVQIFKEVLIFSETL